MTLKMRQLMTILIIIGIIFLFAGCNYNNNENNLKKYFSKQDFVRHSIVENNAKNPLEDFEIQLIEFYDFTKEFFLVWNNHIEDSSALLENFNDKNTTLKEKKYMFQISSSKI